VSTVDKNLYKDLYKVGDLVKYRGVGPDYINLALVIEKTPEMKRYRIKWCRSGEAIWVWGYNLTPVY